jgi:ABC-type nitrate/sulfonate/bicarbonate transport system ATPase subunit
LNLWGNAREGSAVATELQTRPKPAPPRRVDRGLALEGVSHAYRGRRGGPLPVLREVSLRAARDEVLGVVGPSGCGKTTLLELVCALQRPDAGTIRCPPAALLPQHDLLLPWFSALDNAGLALRFAGASRAQARRRAAEAFAQLGLAGFEDARPRELSGGMRQRVAFLRTLLSGKPLLCLDEPFGALDAITRSEMQDWLAHALLRRPHTVVLVTHDVEEAVLLADRIAVLSPRPGSVVEQLDVQIPRPRRRTDARVVALRERALAALHIAARERRGRT